MNEVCGPNIIGVTITILTGKVIDIAKNIIDEMIEVIETIEVIEAIDIVDEITTKEAITEVQA